MLNGDVSASEAGLLREYFDTWLQRGRSFAAMETRGVINQGLSGWRLWCLGSGVEEMNEPDPTVPPGTVLWNPPERTDGRPTLAYGMARSDYNAQSLAALWFVLVITSSEGPLLGRCARCRRYFLNTSGHRNKVFCLPACARDTAARRATKLARVAEHEAKLRRVLSAVAALQDKPREKDVKEWVAKRARVSLWWITRAIKRGDLSLPSPNKVTAARRRRR